jgi:hypothetical protein
MDRRFKAVIEVIGLLISVSGLIVLYKDAHYQILVLLGIISLGFLIFIIIQILTPAISYKRVHWYVDIEDINGKVARARKETTLIANQRKINSLIERHLATMGNFDKFSSNIGDIHGPISEGGSQTVTVLLKAPLEVGKSITMTLSTRILDSFLDKKESISYRIDQQCKEIGLHLSLPENRRAQKAIAHMFFKDRAKKLEPVISEDGRALSIIVDRPIFGAKYVLEWVW